MKIAMRCVLSICAVPLLIAACAMMPGTYYDPTDRYIVGLRWFDRGVYATAIDYWKPLAENGDCDAQFRYGTLFHLGYGVPADEQTALEWTRKAADQGQAFAQMILAGAYLYDGIPASTPKTEVIIACSRGCGRDKDLVKAYVWARLSRDNAVYKGQRKLADFYVTALEGNLEAVAKMSEKGLSADEMPELSEWVKERTLTPDELVQAEQLINAWKPSPSLCKQRKML